MKETDKNAFTLKTLNKSNVWDLQENDVFRLWEAAEKDADLKENMRHYIDILRSAFDMEEVKIDKPEVIKKYEARGFKVGNIRVDENKKNLWAIKKRPIMRVTDLTYENIRHISAAKLMEVIDRNFGGGWDSLSQSIQDIIQSGFDVSTTTLPKDRLHNPGGMYEKKVADGFEVLEIPKGLWVPMRKMRTCRRLRTTITILTTMTTTMRISSPRRVIVRRSMRHRKTSTWMLLRWPTTQNTKTFAVRRRFVARVAPLH